MKFGLKKFEDWLAVMRNISSEPQIWPERLRHKFGSKYVRRNASYTKHRLRSTSWSHIWFHNWKPLTESQLESFKLLGVIQNSSARSHPFIIQQSGENFILLESKTSPKCYTVYREDFTSISFMSLVRLTAKSTDCIKFSSPSRTTSLNHFPAIPRYLDSATAFCVQIQG